MKRIPRPVLFFLFIMGLSPFLEGFEITLTGGAGMNIPEAWEQDNSDPSIPSWYAPDRRAGAEVVLWAPGTWDNLDDFVDYVRPEGAEGSISAFHCWGGEAALADWTFTGSGGQFRGWFLIAAGSGGPEVRVSAITAKGDFSERQPFLLSVLDSYYPGNEWKMTPGAVSTFLELTGNPEETLVSQPFGNAELSWVERPGGKQASQDVIEREALVLSAYTTVPQLFYPAWERYYRIIYRDSYQRLGSLAEALQEGPLPPEPENPKAVAEKLLSWLQEFSYGSTDGLSDLLSPAAACSSRTGDCDSLSLVLLILMDYYGIDGKLLLSQQAHHALAALDLPGRGMRYTEGEKSWIIAELTSSLPLGELPERLTGVNDWFGISLLVKE